VGDPETRKHLTGQALLGVAFGLSTSTARGHLLGTMQVSPAQFGYFAPSLRAASLLGAFTNLKISRLISSRKIAFLGITIMGLGYLGMGYSSLFVFFVLAYAIQQIGNAFVVPVNRAAVMGGVEGALRGRVAAFRGLVIDGATVIGNLFAVWAMSFGTTFAIRCLPPLALAVALVYSRIRRWP